MILERKGEKVVKDNKQKDTIFLSRIRKWGF
jgi:hypothetical protein